MNRRHFIKKVSVGVGSVALANKALLAFSSDEAEPLFKISLAEWSLHKSIFGGQIDHLDFAKVAKKDFGIEAVEYVNQFFFEKAKGTTFLQEMKKRADGEGVRSLLIMCDREGKLGDPDEKARLQAVENHFKWIEAAKYLGCHSIRVNAASEGSFEEQQKLAADGLRRLTEFSAQHGLNTIVENHGGLSSNGKWLAGVMKMVDHPRCGTLPDFGNFRINENELYDNYKGIEEMMPYAKAVSAKSYDFDEKGNETKLDYLRIMKIVTAEGYRGFVGVEYEGDRLSEKDGIIATKKLLEQCRVNLAKK